MKKRILSMLLVLLMVISLIPANVLAVENDVTEPTDSTEENAIPDDETPDDETSDDGIELLSTESATYTVTFSATNQSGAALTYTDIMISRAPSQVVGETLAYVTTNDEGVATYQLADGEYYAYVSYTSGNRKYYDEEFFTVSGAATTVTLAATNSSSTSSAENRYNRVSYFDHVDIRVRGTATSGTNIDFSSYGITLKNVHVVVNNPSENGYQDYNFSFTNSTNYEWRKTRIKVHKEAVVTVTCDIYVNDQLAQSGFSMSFFGKQDFIKAIEQCDGGQGLDFIVNPVDIIQAVMVDVSYQWTMADGSAVPANFPAVPAGETDKEPGYEHTIDTHYNSGYYIIDAIAGYMYVFSGWTDYSDEDTTKTAIPSGSTELALDSDTVIYGVWTAQELEKADSSITITKKFTDSTGAVLPKELHPSSYHIYIKDHNDNVVEVPLSLFTYDSETGVYYYTLPIYEDGSYVFEEHEYAIAGYTSTSQSYVVTEASAAHDHISATSGTADNVTTTLTLDYEGTGLNPCTYLGSIDFTNTYTKAIGEDVHNYPALRLNKMDADTRDVLANAEFSLYKVGENDSLGELVSSQITDDSGYAYFWDVEPGEYWLIETEAPAGYMEGYAQYKVIVTEKAGSPVEQLINGKYCMVHSYDMSVLVNIGDGRGWYPSDHFSEGTTTTRFRLGAFNEKISGQLTVAKDIAGDFDENTYPSDIVVHVSGPNGFERVLTLNKDNDWSMTLTGLELGNYIITERNASVPGYEVNVVIGGITTTTATVTLDKSDVPADYVKNAPVAEEAVTIVNTYLKIEGADVSILPDLHLQKYRTGTTTPVEGAVFTLTDGNGNVIERTTSNLGKITFATLQPGTYTLVETKAPTTYAADTTVYEVVVSEVKREEVLNSEQNHFYDIVTYDVTVTNAASGAFATDTNTFTVYNQKAYGNLTIRKDFGINSALDMSNMRGEIKILVTGPNGYSKEFSMNAENNGVIFIDNLAFGDYTIEEIVSSAQRDGYDLEVTSGNQTVSVRADSETHEITIVNTYAEIKVNPASFTIKKVDADNTNVALEGVTFGLYKDGTLVKEATTDANGEAVFAGFVEAATYTLKEISTLDNYELSTTEWTVTVKLKDGDPTVQIKSGTNFFESIYNWIAGINDGKFKDGVLTVTNKEILGDLTITKAFGNNNEFQPDSVIVTVTGPNNYSEVVTLEKAKGYTYTLKDLHLGEYTVVEQDASQTGYSLDVKYTGVDASNMVTLDTTSDTSPVNVTITNTYTKIYGAPVLPDVEVQKYLAGATTAIGNVEFTLYDANKQVIKSLVTDEKGQASFADLAEGTYYIKETNAPEAYVADTTEYKVVVAYSNEALVEGKWIKTYTATVTPDANFANDTLTVYNEKAVGDITISKSFVDENGDEVTPPDGAIIEVALLDADGNLVQEVELTDANGWEYTVEKLPIGEYTIFENIPSLHGYTWTKADFTVTGTAVIAATDDSVKFKVENGAKIEVGVNNNYKEWDSVDFYVLKTTEDGSTPLAGATFKLYSDANLTTDVTANYLHIDPSIHSYTTNTTAATGVLHFHGFEVADGETAVFYLKETTAPVNYYVNSTVYKITITHDNAGYDINITDKDGNKVSFNRGNDVLTVVNQEILGDLTIEKKFGDGNKFQPDSVKVTVTGPNNYSEVVTLEKAKGYTVTLTGLHLGEYTVTENDASQAGYSLDVKYTGVDENNKVILGADSATTPASVVITNTYTKNEVVVHNPDSFKIQKIDAESGAPLQGVTFALYADKELTKDVTGQYCSNPTSDKDGIIEFGGFTINSTDPKAEVVFYLKEIGAPVNYKISDTVWKVTVKENNGEITVVLKADKNLFENIYDWVVGVDSSKFANGVLTVENSKIPGQLTITKAFHEDSAVKDGSYIVRVTGPDSYKAEVVLSARNNYTAVLEKLEFGEYTVTEIGADKTGYTLTTEYSVTGGKVTIGKDDVTNGIAADSITVTNLYEKIYGASVMPALYVQKYRSNTTTPLGGAQFQLTYTHDENGNPAQGGISIMTDSATGRVGFNLAYPGTYTLVESESPDTYAENNTVYTIVVKYGSEELVGDKWIKTYVIDSVKIGDTPVSLGANNTLVVYNTKDEGTITVEKLFGVNSVLNADTLTGDIKVQVIDSNNQVVDTLTLNKEGEWKATTKLLPLGTYTLKEIEADRDGYFCNVVYTNEGKVEITADVDEPKVNIINTYTTDIYNPTSLEIKKVDSVDGTPIEGVVFGLYADGVSEPVFTATTDSTGAAVFSDLDEAAVYTLKEITPHADYVGTATTWKVTVELGNDGKPVVTEVEANTGLFENIFNWIVGVDPDSEYADGVLTVANTKKTGTLTITKAVEYYLDGEKVQYSELPGEFKDLVDSKYGFEFEINGKKADFELADGGEYTTEELPYGTTYKVGEVLDADSVFNSYVDVEDTDGIVDAESKTIDFVNRYFFWSYTESREDPQEIFEYDWTTFEVTKTDAATDKPLADAEFTLYSDKACTTVVATDVSDENGHLEFVIKAAGTYYLKETKTPAGYIPDDTVYTVIAKAWYEPIYNAEDGFVYVVEHVYVDETDVKVVDNEYVIENEPYAEFEITVKKVWVSRGNMMHPESVEVALYRDGEIYETVKLSKDNNWTYTWTVTEEHEWSVDEPTVPTGYVKSVQVKDNVYTITNTHRDIPNTGDNSNLLLLTVLITLSAMGMVTVSIAGKKRRNAK